MVIGDCCYVQIVPATTHVNILILISLRRSIIASLMCLLLFLIDYAEFINNVLLIYGVSDSIEVGGWTNVMHH